MLRRIAQLGAAFVLALAEALAGAPAAADPVDRLLRPMIECDSTRRRS